MNSGLKLEEQALLETRLNELDDTVPPRAVWQRIEKQARAEGLFRPGVLERSRWLAGGALAAMVVMAVFILPRTPAIDGGSEGLPTVPDFAADAGSESRPRFNMLNALMVQSQQIENDLRALPGQPSLVRAGTAATIAEIEGHIAAIDFTLNHPDLDLNPEQQEVYWRERVRLMNSLLSLRRAQAQRMSF